MSAEIIDGKAVAAEVRERVAAGVREFARRARGDAPGWRRSWSATIPASQVYVGEQAPGQTEEVGMRSIHHEPPADAPRRTSCST